MLEINNGPGPGIHRTSLGGITPLPHCPLKRLTDRTSMLGRAPREGPSPVGALDFYADRTAAVGIQTTLARRLILGPYWRAEEGHDQAPETSKQGHNHPHSKDSDRSDSWQRLAQVMPPGSRPHDPRWGGDQELRNDLLAVDCTIRSESFANLRSSPLGAQAFLATSIRS